MASRNSIQSYNELRSLFANQVKQDNKQFGISSIFLPNPVFTLTPKFCLLAMEPSLAGMTPERFQDSVNNGFTNFIHSEDTLILQYCAYRFLCKDSFNYHLTDISKGAMNTDLANQQRNIRFRSWRELLKDELEFFGNPQIISIGGKVRDFLDKKDFQMTSSLMHYSQNNCGRFSIYHEQNSEKLLTEKIHFKLREFTTEVLERLNYNTEMQRNVLEKVFTKELSNWKKGLFLYYMEKFKSLHNG